VRARNIDFFPLVCVAVELGYSPNNLRQLKRDGPKKKKQVCSGRFGWAFNSHTSPVCSRKGRGMIVLDQDRSKKKNESIVN